MTKESVEKTIGKKVTFIKSFPLSGDFEAYTEACKELEALGVSHGSMQRGSPIGLAFGDVAISKWRNLGTDVLELDGLLIADEGSFRNGTLTIYLADKPEGV